MSASWRWKNESMRRTVSGESVLPFARSRARARPTPVMPRSLGGFAAVRYLAGGGLDPSFGGGGTVFTAFSDTFGSGANAVAPQPDGKLVLAGFARHPERAHDGFAVVRYLQDGRLDPTFAGSGGVITAVDPQSGAGHNDIGRAVAVDPQGRILVAGETGGAFKDLALVRYLADGSLDPAFGDGGGVVTDLGGDDRAQALALQPDGKILVAGSGGRTSNEDFVLVRYLPDGRLDPSFGQGGHVTTDFRGGADRGQGLALRRRGQFLNPHDRDTDFGAWKAAGSRRAAMVPPE